MVKRKQPPLKAERPQGRPMANGQGLKRARQRVRHQVKTMLRTGEYDNYED